MAKRKEMYGKYKGDKEQLMKQKLPTPAKNKKRVRMVERSRFISFGNECLTTLANCL
ncbi:hypothetical protein bthur0011_58190 [Bacillus thuringiensis serovar huazhongensis BGSC 4BD1]|nr:hypothetical protein bthur0011_58190 [Bacillus thuringiensis serovar huazhongensis BGSC 4BD1]